MNITDNEINFKIKICGKLNRKNEAFQTQNFNAIEYYTFNNYGQGRGRESENSTNYNYIL